jgi:hypothetical protein
MGHIKYLKVFILSEVNYESKWATDQRELIR